MSFHHFRAVCVVLVLLFPPAGSLAGGPDLVWFAEGPDERPFRSAAGDQPINPASVIKVATSLWALHELGKDHRFETQFAIRGSLNPENGVLDGDLLVLGAGDPDFHVENAYLVARALNERGLREISGSLLVNESFWIGWEGGSERRESDPDRRALLMASRLRDALDPQRWNRATRRSIAEFRTRRGISAAAGPRIVLHGGLGRAENTEGAQLLLSHRSNNLVRILKRFNAYSNNDIERLELALGGPAELEGFLAGRWQLPAGELQLASLSGLGVNRLSARLVVRLLRDLRELCAEQGIQVTEILPMTGCDPGTLESFPILSGRRFERSLVAKTGTLVSTGGGVTVLAGYARTAKGEAIFCVAVPGSGSRITKARRAEEAWLTELIDAEFGGPVQAGCGAPVLFSDHDAQLTAP